MIVPLSRIQFFFSLTSAHLLTIQKALPFGDTVTINRSPPVNDTDLKSLFRRENLDRLEVVTFAARFGEDVSMKRVDADIAKDRHKTLQHAQSIQSDIQEDMKMIYHTIWFGALNANTLTAIKSCYYYNIRTAGDNAANNREIWMWVPHVDQTQTDPLYYNFSQYVKWKQYDFTYEKVGSPVENWENPLIVKATAMSDLARDIVLYTYGGFYFDMDLITLRSWDPLLKEYPDQMLAYAWENQNYPNNAFLYSPARHPTRWALFDFMMKQHSCQFGFQKCNLFYSTNVPLTVLPWHWFDDGWMLSEHAPGHFSNFFNETNSSDWNIPGAFGYHWHNQWTATPHSSSRFAHFKRQIDALLASTM